MGSFAAGAGTRFVVTSTSSQSSGTVLNGPITAIAGTATTDTPAFNITQTWNNAAVTFTGFRFNVTDTASNSNSFLIDLQVDGNSRFSVSKRGFVVNAPTGAEANFYLGNVGLTDNGIPVGLGGTLGMTISGSANKGVVLSRDRTMALAWNASGRSALASDCILASDAANTLAQRNGTNAQTFRVYNTFTDASNYERLSVDWTSNVAYIRPQNAGTGSSRLFVPVTGSTTVASLPAAATAGAGARAFVTDATVTIFASTVVGGGANAVPVVSNGTNWIIG